MVLVGLSGMTPGGQAIAMVKHRMMLPLQTSIR